MPLYLNSAPIGICDRCGFKFPWKDLIKDGNSPGLRVCCADFDEKNPWRLPPIVPDRIALKWSRPDVPLVAGNVQYPDLTNPVNPIPPANTFTPVEGLEGTGNVTLEGGGEIVGFEP